MDMQWDFKAFERFENLTDLKIRFIGVSMNMTQLSMFAIIPNLKSFSFSYDPHFLSYE